MVKVCARPACGAEATARFFFDASARLVILDARIEEWGGSGILCDDHADRLTPPRGWVIDDRRVLAPRLFPVGRFENADRPAPRAAASRGTSADEPANSAAEPANSAADTASTGSGTAGTAADSIPGTSAPQRVRRFATPAAHPSTPLPLDGGPSYALPEEYLARELTDSSRAADAPERLTDTADPGTPLLSRAFDAARSKVRPTSTLDTLIPHAG